VRIYFRFRKGHLRDSNNVAGKYIVIGIVRVILFNIISSVACCTASL